MKYPLAPLVAAREFAQLTGQVRTSAPIHSKRTCLGSHLADPILLRLFVAPQQLIFINL